MPKLLPSRTKFRKTIKGEYECCFEGNSVSFGEFGIQSLSRGRMTSNQIEAARVAINRHLKRKEKFGFSISSQASYQKPAETGQEKVKDL